MAKKPKEEADKAPTRHPIQVRVTEAELKLINAARRSFDDLPSLSAAVLRLALEAAEKRAKRAG